MTIDRAYRIATWTVIAIMFSAVALCLFAMAGCASTGSDVVDKAIVASITPPGFWDKLVDFVQEIILPVAVGAGVFLVTSGTGTLVQALAGSTATATTALAMQDDPGPTSVTKNDIHLTAEKGSHVQIDASNPLASTAAASEPLMQTIEHYGFYIAIAYIFYLRREWIAAWVRGKIADQYGSSIPVVRSEALKHAVFAGRKSREAALGKKA